MPSDRPVTIGTAGHIDHGKSALVRALTGIDPDRLAEEQRRGMTLDLGFAHLDLPGGRRVGIVDVPGHEALIHHMLAGAGGLDLVMLVVAADEGAMPQTREHVDILRFLRLHGGVVVLTKIDLVDDADWAAAVEEDLAGLVAGTALEAAPVVRVSARTGEGLPGLIAALEAQVARVPPRPVDGPVRLPVDRSFTMQGFGTVVTGTLWSGTIRAGDVLALQPQGREVRVRGLQAHGRPVPAAVAGGRVAVNLAAIEKDEVARGDVLVSPGAYRPTERLEATLRLLPGAPALRTGARMHVHLGSGATVARVTLLDRSDLQPGEEGLVRVRLEGPVVAVHGDRFVVRRYSPTRTVGGGVVTNTSPARRRRAAQDAVARQAQEGPEDLIVGAAAAQGQAGLAVAEAAAAAGVDRPAAGQAMADALRAGRLVEMGDRLIAREVIDRLQQSIEEALRAYHERTPWRRGMPRDELKSRVMRGGSDRLFDEALTALRSAGRLADRQSLVALAGFAPRVSEGDRKVREAIAAALERAGSAPPSVDELRSVAPADAVDRMLQDLLDEGRIVAVSQDLRYAVGALEAVRRQVVELLRAGQDLTVAALRDRLQTSRRYALPLLEYFDSIRVTRRVGDRRVLGVQPDVPIRPRA